MKLSWLWLTPLLGLAGSLPGGHVLGDSVTLRPIADTSLFEAAPDNNLGGNSNLVSGANGSEFLGRALIQFNLGSAIPSNALIQSVALSLNVVIVPAGGGVASVYDMRRILVSWNEGQGTGNPGSPAQAGETTWNSRHHPATPWSVPGGASDFSSSVSAATWIGNEGHYTFESSPGLVTDVQQWLVDPSTNFGWALMSESESTALTARRFAAREDTNRAPELVVHFTLPTAPDLHGVRLNDSNIEFGFVARAGQLYAVEFRDSLTAGGWSMLTNIHGLDTNVIVFDAIQTNALRVYRVVER